ncbi:MAG TPA: hypothetical protein VN735_01525 [Steroidobacteraceae bacterium]|nr:hypothetical protein [Steroidobacteraceae bacterium]
MRLSLSLLIVGACAAGPIALAQTATGLPATSQPAASQPATSEAATAEAATSRAAASQPAAGQSAGVQHSAHRALRSSSGHSPSAHPGHPGKGNKGSAVAGAGGVLNLGATDITGNKELPKVMVIVPWKGSLGADGVIKPTDSLMDEVLAPVDRSVFQRQVRYYGQLSGRGGAPAGSRVAPVGDSH